MQTVIYESSKATDNITHIYRDTEDSKKDTHLLNTDIDMVIEKVKDATQDTTKASIYKGVSDISDTNIVNLEKMNTVFAENMSLMEYLNPPFNIKEVFKNTIEDYIA